MLLHTKRNKNLSFLNKKLKLSQLVTTGRDLWSVMYGTVSGNDGTARELFQQFRVKELTINIRSSECVCVC